jgi:predicted metal-dependent hydrolase
VWGRRYLLKVVEEDSPPSIDVKHNRLLLRVRPGSSECRRHQLVEEWYREQVKIATTELIAKWEPAIGVTVAGFYVQRMKTRWGSCNSEARTIRLNTDLARKPRECLEYIVVHEMIHILVPTHNELFQTYMSRCMPDWRHRRDVLNRLPVRHENWEY